MSRVLIAYRYVPQYRAPFYPRLRKRLAEAGIQLDVVYGDPSEADSKKNDAASLDWAIYRPNIFVPLGKRQLIYQPIAKLARTYDLVIVEQATKLLVNPLLMAMNALGLIRLAYWGHGKDFQDEGGPIGRVIKRILIPYVHWWFAYNETSASVVRKAGFPDARITRVMNTIDTEDLSRSLNEVTSGEIAALRRQLSLTEENICLYIGGIYDKKRIPFLLAACDRIRKKIPDFQIVFLGSGAQKPLVDQFAATRNWVKVRGATFGHEKAIFLKMAKLILMPGLVGLVIIDSFAAEVPIVTTAAPYHSPEIEYLESGVNGECIPYSDDIEAYAATVIELLNNKTRLAALREGCRQSAKKYSMQAMVERFAAGIVKALE